MLFETLSPSAKLKQFVGLSFCVLIPILWYLNYHILSHTVFVMYLAFVFYDAEHYNIRFIIGLLAIIDMLSIFSEFLIKFVTRVLIDINDFTPELISLTFSEFFISVLACIAILHRGRLVDAFRKTTKVGQTYRLIGMEWLLLVSFFMIAVLEIGNFIVLFPHILSVTDFASLIAFHNAPPTIGIHDVYYHIFIAILVLQLFSLQSYNYKRFRREWRLIS